MFRFNYIGSLLGIKDAEKRCDCTIVFHYSSALLPASASVFMPCLSEHVLRTHCLRHPGAGFHCVNRERSQSQCILQGANRKLSSRSG